MQNKVIQILCQHLPRLKPTVPDKIDVWEASNGVVSCQVYALGKLINVSIWFEGAVATFRGIEGKGGKWSFAGVAHSEDWAALVESVQKLSFLEYFNGY